ncbi:hypothetical protein GOB50_30715 [Sinorhizobium meliloti]|nr:hypothetical protein [Sinorhizobium meliloti]
MRSRILSVLATGYFGLCGTLQSAELPDFDYQNRCAEDHTDKFRSAVCLAIEKNAQKDLAAKWSKIPDELKDNCSKESDYDSIASCVMLGVISLKGKKGLCPGGPCTADPELDQAAPVARFGDPDITPFPTWDSATLCETSLKPLGLVDEVETCATEERLSKVRVALLWSKLSEELRFVCVDRVGGFQSYSILNECFTGVFNSK